MLTLLHVLFVLRPPAGAQSSHKSKMVTKHPIHFISTHTAAEPATHNRLVDHRSTYPSAANATPGSTITRSSGINQDIALIDEHTTGRCMVGRLHPPVTMPLLMSQLASHRPRRRALCKADPNPQTGSQRHPWSQMTWCR